MYRYSLCKPCCGSDRLPVDECPYPEEPGPLCRDYPGTLTVTVPLGSIPGYDLSPAAGAIELKKRHWAFCHWRGGTGGDVPPKGFASLSLEMFIASPGGMLVVAHLSFLKADGTDFGELGAVYSVPGRNCDEPPGPSRYALPITFHGPGNQNPFDVWPETITVS